MAAKRKGNIMEEMTVKDMIDALTETSTAILVCGGTEQHGYHLPLSTDYISVYAVGKEVSRQTRCLLLPPLCYSYSGGKLPGTTDISPATTTLVVTEIGLSIAEQGVRNVVLLVGHCGTEHLHAVREAGYRIMERAKGVTAAFAPVLSLSKTWIELLAGGGEHAGEGETSFMLYTHPHLVRNRRPYDTAKTRKPRPPEKPKAPAFLVKDFILTKRPASKREAPYVYGVPNDGALRASRKFGKVLFDEMAGTLVKLVKSMERRRTTKRKR